jgi:hypothetical protein
MVNILNTDLKADLDKFPKERFDPINRKMIKQEKERYKQFLEQHVEKYEKLDERHDNYISQLITLEGVILGATIIFTNAQQVTIWLVGAVCLILVSLIFGIWRQKISVEAGYQSHEWDYYQELKSHWWRREELWKDDSVKIEKKLIEPYLKKTDGSYKNKFEYKLLKLLRLNADRIETVFIVSFLLSLFLLILHLLFKAHLS